MTALYLFGAYVGAGLLILWAVSRKAANAAKIAAEFELVKKEILRNENKTAESDKIIGRFINLDSLALSERVREKRAAAQARASERRLRDKN